MRNKKPLVSVIMPVYNGSLFVGQAIKSILAQTYDNLEFIIVDDGSEDDTSEILREYQRKYPNKVKVIALKKNKGGSAAANIGFKTSKGEFIARMDADDISHPRRIEKQIEYMLSHPDVVLLGTQAKVINEEGEVVGRKTFPKKHEDIYREYAIFHPMLHPSCMIRRSLIPDKERLYEDKYGSNDDYYTFFRLLNYGKFANLGADYLYYRIHTNNESLQSPKSRFLNSLRIRVAAVKNLGYKPTPKAVALVFAQLVVVGILPEKLIVPTYMFLRGMRSPAKATSRFALKLPQLNIRENLSFLRS